MVGDVVLGFLGSESQHIERTTILQEVFVETRLLSSIPLTKRKPSFVGEHRQWMLYVLLAPVTMMV